MFFKTNKIKYLRKKLKDNVWVKDRIKLLLHFSNKMNHYRMFDCSDFFRGYQLAKRNRIWADKREKQINRQLLFLEGLFKK